MEITVLTSLKPWLQSIFYCGQFIARAIIRIAVLVAPKKDLLVVRSLPDFDDSTRNLIHVAASDLRRTVVLCDREPGSEVREQYPDETEFRRVRSTSGLMAFATAKYVAYTHGLYGTPRPVRSHIVCNLWHGMPLKTTSGGAGDQPPLFDFTIATSRRFALLLQDSFTVGPESLELVGLPRNDSLGAKPGIRENFILILPTWRRAETSANSNVGDPQAWSLGKKKVQELSELLYQLGCTAIVKPHPLTPPDEFDNWKSPNIEVISDEWLLNRGLSLYELISSSAALVTDYSSVAVDYLVTRRPVYFLQLDLREYQESRGLNFSAEELKLLGYQASSWEDFLRALSSLPSSDLPKNSHALDMFYEVEPQGASRKIMDLMVSRLEQKQLRI